MELGDEFFLAYLDIAAAHLAHGDPERALDWYRRGQAIDGSVRSYDAWIVRALAKLDRHDGGEEILARLEQESKQHYVRSELMAAGYAALGEFEKAFDALERAFQTRSAGLIYLNVDPAFAPLRSDPRFGDLTRRIGLK